MKSQISRIYLNGRPKAESFSTLLRINSFFSPSRSSADNFGMAIRLLEEIAKDELFYSFRLWYQSCVRCVMQAGVKIVLNSDAAREISGGFGGLPAEIPHLFHNTAPSRDLSWEERMLLRRTRKQFKDWEFRLWTDDDLDVIIRDDHAAVYEKYRAITRGILRSDIGRYAILYRCGGIYADTDYKFTMFPNELVKVPCTLPVEAGVEPGGKDGHDEPFRLGNALLASVRGHTFWRDLIEHIFATNSLSPAPRRGSHQNHWS